MLYETLNVNREGAVLFVEIAAPPMNLLEPELVRDLVSLIEQAEADDAIRVLVFNGADPDDFISHVDAVRRSAWPPPDQPDHNRRSVTQNSRSKASSRGRGCFLINTASCCRRAANSNTRRCRVMRKQRR